MVEITQIICLTAGTKTCNGRYLVSDKAFLFTFSNSEGEYAYKMELLNYKQGKAMKCLKSDSKHFVIGEGDIYLKDETSSNHWMLSSALPASYASPVATDHKKFLFNEASTKVSDVEVLYIGGINDRILMCCSPKRFFIA